MRYNRLFCGATSRLVITLVLSILGLNTMVWQHPLFLQICRFGIIGVFAAIIHLYLEIQIVSFFHLQPLVANIFAYGLAFNVSYFGHKYWTFNNHQTPHRTSLRRFAVVAAMGFLLNESLFFVFLVPFKLHYPFALFITLCLIPPLTFVWSKFWAFKNHESEYEYGNY